MNTDARLKDAAAGRGKARKDSFKGLSAPAARHGRLRRWGFLRTDAMSLTCYRCKSWPCTCPDSVTLIHGDCRDVLPQLPPVDLVLTDPPYGISLDTDYTRFNGNSPSRNWGKAIAGDSDAFDPSLWLSLCPIVCMFGANYFSDSLPLGKWLVWNKRDEGPSRVLADAEIAWHNASGKSVQVFNWFWIGCYRKGAMGQEPLHPTQKPVELMKWCFGILGGGLALDPFAGSGTTLLAAKQLGRKAIGIEICEDYCRIAASRLKQSILPFSDEHQVEERQSVASPLFFDGMAPSADNDEV